MYNIQQRCRSRPHIETFELLFKHFLTPKQNRLQQSSSLCDGCNEFPATTLITGRSNSMGQLVGDVWSSSNLVYISSYLYLCCLHMMPAVYQTSYMRWLHGIVRDMKYVREQYPALIHQLAITYWSHIFLQPHSYCWCSRVVISKREPSAGNKNIWYCVKFSFHI